MYFVLPNNDIHFYKENGELLTVFQINSLFKEVEHQKINLFELKVIVRHFSEKSFILMVNNYLLLLSLVFDK